MSEENTSIHDFDLDIVCEYFSHLERQGPGSQEMTIKALSFVDKLNSKSRIADIGCGTGGQTITLAQNTPGQIVAIDLFPKFIDILKINTRQLDLDNRIEAVVGSMDNLLFKDKELDLIWSEGSIYNIGFERGLRDWRRYLKKGGFVVVSEASWFTEQRPKEIDVFWQKAYPEIDTISRKVAVMEKSGYIPVATFTLPENCWIDNFYKPQTAVRENFLKKYQGNKNIKEFITNEKHEADLYYKYKSYYGYVFYIGKKI